MTGRVSAALAGVVLVGAIAALAVPEVAFPQQRIAGQARTIDGDTIEVASRRIRIFGIDAPELHQRCGQVACGLAAKAAMERMTRDAVVTCAPRDPDRYGRIVAQCSTVAGDLGARMVALGMAVDYPRYSGGLYRDQQEAAKAEHLGIWATGFVNPWEFRRGKR